MEADWEKTGKEKAKDDFRIVMELTREEIIRQRNADFLHSFSGPHGERTLKYLSRFCLENRSTFVEGSERKSAFNEGARAVIIEIRRWLDYDLTNLEKE